MTAPEPRPRRDVLDAMVLEVVHIIRGLGDRSLTLRLEPLWDEYLAAASGDEERERHRRAMERRARPAGHLSAVRGGWR